MPSKRDLGRARAALIEAEALLHEVARLFARDAEPVNQDYAPEDLDEPLRPTHYAEVGMAWPRALSAPLQAALAHDRDVAYRVVEAEGPGGGWPTVQVYGTREAVAAFLEAGRYDDQEPIPLWRK